MPTTIIATKSPYLKCERCWYHKPDCDYNKYFEGTLCYRCVQVLVDLANKGWWQKCPACIEWFCDKNCTKDDINDNYLCQDCMKEMEK